MGDINLVHYHFDPKQVFHNMPVECDTTNKDRIHTYYTLH